MIIGAFALSSSLVPIGQSTDLPRQVPATTRGLPEGLSDERCERGRRERQISVDSSLRSRGKSWSESQL